MKIRKTLTSRENQIMDVLWNNPNPMSAQQIKQHCDDLSIYSVQQVLQRLLNYEYICVDDIGYTKKALTRLFSAKLTQAEYIQYLLGNNSKSFLSLASCFISENCDEETLDELERLIQEHKNKFEE